VEYPANSHKAKHNTSSSTEEPKKVEKIIKGEVIIKKKTFGKKLTEMFFGDNVDNVFSYIIYDIFVPAAKSTFSDMISGSIEMLLFGENRNRRGQRDRGSSYINYERYHNKDRDRSTNRTRQNYARHNFDDIILSSRGEAEEVLSHLVDLIETYGMASVADLYDLVGITSSYTDTNFGWYNLASAHVNRISSGYLINLPRVVVLD
jgi:hypothetical protein